MRRSLLPAAAVLGALTVLAPPAAASAQGPSNLVCNGTYSGVYASVTVPPNQVCNLSNATVLGDAQVSTNATLNLSDPAAPAPAPVSINGQVLIGSGGSYSQYNGDQVGGTLTAQGAATVAISGGTNHDIVSNGSQSFYVYGDTLVSGSVTANQTQSFGEVAVSYGPTSGITGNVVDNGDPSTSGGFLIEGQEVGGSVYITNNQSPTEVYFNTIDQDLVCTGNTPAPDDNGYGNWVRGNEYGQCTGLTSKPKYGASRS